MEFSMRYRSVSGGLRPVTWSSRGFEGVSGSSEQRFRGFMSVLCATQGVRGGLRRFLVAFYKDTGGFQGGTRSLLGFQKVSGALHRVEGGVMEFSLTFQEVSDYFQRVSGACVFGAFLGAQEDLT